MVFGVGISTVGFLYKISIIRNSVTPRTCTIPNSNQFKTQLHRLVTSLYKSRLLVGNTVLNCFALLINGR